MDARQRLRRLSAKPSKTKKNKSIRDTLPREGERNITDAFLQQKSRPPYQ